MKRTERAKDPAIGKTQAMPSEAEKPKKKIKRPYRVIGFCRQCKARYFVDLDAPFSVRFYCDACRAKHAKDAQ
ncbi:hypothetical protein HZB03_01765 [Candidatus Woesearchaeota archaeon]|nr:hypothetical protein [Candidatus Woesearchaeota archaeon]